MGMSRIGRRVLELPENVTSTFDKDVLTIKGPLGTLTQVFLKHVIITLNEKSIETKINTTNKKLIPLLGTYNSLINNMIIGVTKGYKKDMLIKGVGYGVKLEGTKLTFSLGKSHKDIIDIPTDIKVNIVKPTEFNVSGIDKQRVGQFCMICKSLRKVEPYGGKGIMYKDEIVRRKAGKVSK